MTGAEIRAVKAAGNSDFEVLHMVVSSGREYPDAVWAVTQALGMKPDEVKDMEDAYDNNV